MTVAQPPKKIWKPTNAPTVIRSSNGYCSHTTTRPNHDHLRLIGNGVSRSATTYRQCSHVQALREWRPFFPKFGEGDEDRDAFYWDTETHGLVGASRLEAIAKKNYPRCSRPSRCRHPSPRSCFRFRHCPLPSQPLMQNVIASFL